MENQDTSGEDLVQKIRAAIQDGTEQGTQSWLQLRIGKFTGSEIYRLMGQGKRAMTPAELDAREKGPRGGLLDKRTTVEDDTILSDAAITYIEEKVAEVWTGQSASSPETFATEWGIQNESDARELFAAKYGFKILLTGHKSWEFGKEDAGCSLDGEIEGQDANIEIKCPFNSGIHVSYCRITDPKDLPKAYWWQMQMGMMVTNKSSCYFISYDPRVRNEKNRMHVLVVPADEEAHSLLALKLRLAINEKKSILESLK